MGWLSLLEKASRMASNGPQKFKSFFQTDASHGKTKRACDQISAWTTDHPRRAIIVIDPELLFHGNPVPGFLPHAGCVRPCRPAVVYRAAGQHLAAVRTCRDGSIIASARPRVIRALRRSIYGLECLEELQLFRFSVRADSRSDSKVIPIFCGS